MKKVLYLLCRTPDCGVIEKCSQVKMKNAEFNSVTTSIKSMA